jgi:hypothetical protein
VPFAPVLSASEFPGREGFFVSYEEVETRNMFGDFAYDADFTRYVPPFSTTVYLTEIDDKGIAISGCDG